MTGRRPAGAREVVGAGRVGAEATRAWHGAESTVGGGPRTRARTRAPIAALLRFVAGDGLTAALLLLATHLLWFLPIEPAPSDLLALLAIMVFAARLLLGTARLSLSPAVVLLVVFAVVQLAPALWATAALSSWFYGGVTAYLVIAAVLTGTLAPARVIGAYRAAAVVAGGIVLLLFALQLAGVPTVGLDLAYRALAGASATGVDAAVPGLFFGDRPKGFFKDPNVVGAFLATATLLPVTRLLLARDPRARRNAFVLGVFLALATAATLSRAAVLGVIAGGFVLLVGLFVSGRLAPRRLAAMLGVSALLALMAGLVVLGNENAGARFLQINPYDFDRAATWWRGVQAFVAQPAGYGPGMFLSATTSGGFSAPYAAHSTWVRLLVENGALGLLAFLAAVATVVLPLLAAARRAVRDRAVTDVQLTQVLWCTAALAATLLESFVIDTLHWRHLWVLVGIALGVAAAHRRPVPGASPIQ